MSKQSDLLEIARHAERIFADKDDLLLRTIDTFRNGIERILEAANYGSSHAATLDDLSNLLQLTKQLDADARRIMEEA